MKYLLKQILQPIYNYVKAPYYREFNKLYNKWGKYPRHRRVNNVKFLNYRIDVPDLQSFIWQFKEIFVSEIYKFESQSNSPLIYDCGANIGLSCLYFKHLYPNARIKAFEADPIIVNILKHNLIKNGVTDVEIIDKAVWIDYSGVEFASEGADGGSIKGKVNKIEIGSLRLKDFLEKQNEKIDFLKIDIEGAELEVLRDCQDELVNIQNIFVEYHSWSKSVQRLSDILNIFERNGFRYYIEDIAKRKHPLINHNREGDMDLQLNIFGYRL